MNPKKIIGNKLGILNILFYICLNELNKCLTKKKENYAKSRNE